MSNLELAIQALRNVSSKVEITEAVHSLVQPGKPKETALDVLSAAEGVGYRLIRLDDKMFFVADLVLTGLQLMLDPSLTSPDFPLALTIYIAFDVPFNKLSQRDRQALLERVLNLIEDEKTPFFPLIDLVTLFLMRDSSLFENVTTFLKPYIAELLSFSSGKDSAQMADSFERMFVLNVAGLYSSPKVPPKKIAQTIKNLRKTPKTPLKELCGSNSYVKEYQKLTKSRWMPF